MDNRSLTTLFLVGALLCPIGDAAGQTITQVLDASGDGSTTVDFPNVFGADPTGNVFVGSSNTGAVFKVTPEGALDVVFGPSVLFVPAGAVDTGGNLYAAVLFLGAPGFESVRRIPPSGQSTVIIDVDGAGGGSQLSGIAGVAVSDSGDVLVSGSESDNVFRIPAGGPPAQIIGGSGDGSNPLDTPASVAVDGDGNAFVVGFSSANVFRISPGGLITQILDASGDGAVSFVPPGDLTVDPAGNVYASSPATDTVFRITPAGAISRVIGAVGDGFNALDGAGGLCADAAGNVYVTGLDSDNAFRISPGGVITQIIDASGDGANALDRPGSCHVDDDGNVFVSGWDSHNVFRIAAALPPVDATSNRSAHLLMGLLLLSAAWRLRRGASPAYARARERPGRDGRSA